MSRNREQLELARYLEYQRAFRSQRIETLGGAVTAMVLATVDMGVSGAHDPARGHEGYTSESEFDHQAEVTPLRAVRQRQLAEFATEAAELGYAQAA